MQSQPDAMIRSRRLMVGVIVLLTGVATAGTPAIPSVDLPAIATQLPKRAAQYAGKQSTILAIP